MGTVGLFLSGATLFLNSLMLLGKANAKSVGVFNLFIGALQVIIPLYLIMISDQSNWVLFNNGATFLFGLTFLFVGVINLKGYEGDALGWYSLWVAIIALVYAVVAIARSHDILNMLTWLHWSFLWLLFYLSMAAKKDIGTYVGKVAQIQSWLTLTIPAMFTMLGIANIPWIRTLLIASLLLSIVYYVITAVSFRKSYAAEADAV